MSTFRPALVYEALLADNVGASSYWLESADGGKIDTLARLLIEVQSWARKAAIVRIDNVLDYANSMEAKSYSRSIPIAAPPVEVLWLEGETEALIERGKGVPTTTERASVAALILGDRVGEGAAMHVTAMGLCLGASGNAVPQFVLEYTTAVNGSMDLSKPSRTFNLSAHPEVYPAEAGFAFILALSFMHCENVARQTVEPGRTVRRVAVRRKEPIYSYDVLEIGPIKKILEDEGDASGQGIARALHICRGHFSTYSPERPLFGKFAGRFWIPMHVRGNASSGVAVRDYVVEPPALAKRE